MNYTREEIQKAVKNYDRPGVSSKTIHDVCEDWLEKDAELELQDAEILRLQKAAAAVMEEWEKYQPKDLSGVMLNLAVEVLRINAGLKALPADEAITIPEGE